MKIADADGAEVAEGEAGEILVRSDMAMLGYLNRPEDTAEVFRSDGFAKTGDVGRKVIATVPGVEE